MTHAHTTLYRRSALALSSVALTLSVCVAGMPHAAADPYDGDDTTEVISSDPGYDISADTGAGDQDEWAGPDVTDTGDWDQGGGNDDADPEQGSQDVGPENEPAPAADAPEQADTGADEQPQQTDQDPAPIVGGPPEPGAADQPDTEVDEPPAQTATPDIDTAQVDQNDFDLAQVAAPVDADPQPASPSEVQELRESLQSELSSTTTLTSSKWSSSVTQWNSSWVGYDTYYRPIITNPYRTPLQLVYSYGDTTQTVTVAPLQRTVLAVPTPGVYSFTALTRTDGGSVATVSTGTFSGGGYVPAPGQKPPVKPIPPKTYQNVLVQMHYSAGTSHPFRVNKLTDLGKDAAVGAERVLLDDETTAWGNWSTPRSGERLFEITKTQQLPGLTAPSEGPLPGYDVQLAAAQGTHDMASSIDPLVITAVSCGALGLASAAFFVIARRRDRSQ